VRNDSGRVVNVGNVRGIARMARGIDLRGVRSGARSERKRGAIRGILLVSFHMSTVYQGDSLALLLTLTRVDECMYMYRLNRSSRQ
jgi:hypothetical protein